MALQFVVYVAIPDEEILEAQEFAESLCTRLGGSCDWQFHDSERVVYWFTKAEAWDAFRAHCAVREWNLAEQEGRLITGSLSVQQSRRPTSPRARRGHRRKEGGQTITDETKGAAPRRRRRTGRGGRPKRQRPEVPLGDAALRAVEALGSGVSAEQIREYLGRELSMQVRPNHLGMVLTAPPARRTG